MMLGRAGRFLITAALLAAQQAALGHQIWHLGASASGNAVLPAGQGEKPKPAQERFCDLHAGLGVVVGALDCVSADVTVVSAGDAPFRYPELPAPAAPRLAPASRGPPALL